MASDSLSEALVALEAALDANESAGGCADALSELVEAFNDAAKEALR
jgi:hypothetical protein